MNKIHKGNKSDTFKNHRLNEKKKSEKKRDPRQIILNACLDCFQRTVWELRHRGRGDKFATGDSRRRGQRDRVARRESRSRSFNDVGCLVGCRVENPPFPFLIQNLGFPNHLDFKTKFLQNLTKIGEVSFWDGFS